MGANNKFFSRGIIAIPIAIVVAALFLSAGTSVALVMSEKNKYTRELAVESPNGESGTPVKCVSWNKVDFEVQSRIEKASQAQGVHPAFLASIYWKENGEQFKGINGPFSCNKYGCGPFQILRSTNLPTSTLMDFSQAVVIAAGIAKSKAKAMGVNPSLATTNDAKALALSYNRGEGVGRQWVQAGFPELTAGRIVEYQKKFRTYSRHPLGQAGDFYNTPRNKDTQWWFAEVAHNYVTRFIGTFEGLKGNCQ